MPSSRSLATVLGSVGLVLCAGCMPPAEEDDDHGDQNSGGTAAPAPTGAGGAGGMTGGSGGTRAAGSTGSAGNPGSMGGSGAGAAGASGAAGALSSAAGTSGNDSAIDVGNFFKSGDWMGYVWTSVSGDGSTITPMTFEGATTGMPRCVSGSVGPMDDFSGTAILGFNLNEGAGATAMPIAPTKAGVNINLTNTAGSVLRLQVQTASTGGTQWCTAITGSGGFIPWDNLRTACWGSTGVKYNREPIVSVMVLVPGKDMMPVAFDFCVNELAEADGASGGGSGGSGGTGGAGGGGGAGGSGGAGGGGSGGAGGGGSGGSGG